MKKQSIRTHFLCTVDILVYVYVRVEIFARCSVIVSCRLSSDVVYQVSSSEVMAKRRRERYIYNI